MSTKLPSDADPHDYVFGLTPLTKPSPYLVFATKDYDEGGFAVCIPIHERPEWGSPTGDVCIAINARGDMLDDAVARMVAELWEIEDAALQIEEAIAGSADEYWFSWGPVAYDDDRYVFPPGSTIIGEYEERAVLRNFMRLVVAKLRDSAPTEES